MWWVWAFLATMLGRDAAWAACPPARVAQHGATSTEVVMQYPYGGMDRYVFNGVGFQSSGICSGADRLCGGTAKRCPVNQTCERFTQCALFDTAPRNESVTAVSAVDLTRAEILRRATRGSVRSRAGFQLAKRGTPAFPEQRGGGGFVGAPGGSAPSRSRRWA